VTVATADGVTVGGRVADGAAPAAGDEATIAIRPESVRLAASPVGEAQPGWTWLPGRVTSDTYLGDQHEYRVAVPGLGELVARSQAQGADGQGRAFRSGEDVVVGWHDTSALVLTS
jgi:ABC-type Fe3+/spermidine/putrescine transport system ATPase subunit